MVFGCRMTAFALGAAISTLRHSGDLFATIAKVMLRTTISRAK